MSYCKSAYAYPNSLYGKNTFDKSEFQTLYQRHSTKPNDGGVSNIMERFKIPGTDKYVYPSSTDVKYYEKHYDYFSKN